jgi:hypothetical protein
MIQWLRNKLHNFIFPPDNSRPELAMVTKSGRPSSREQDDISFTVSVARGGLIVSVRTYDEKRDHHLYTNHIIHDDQDASKNIADIVSVELMKR